MANRKEQANQIAELLTGEGGDAAVEMMSAKMYGEDQEDPDTDGNYQAPEPGGDAAQEMALAEQDAEQEESAALDEGEILNIITSELDQSSTGTYATEIDGNREESLAYYLGNPRGDEQAGRSTIVSTDVADAIEWILPQIIKALVSKGPVITFDAISEEDEEQAQMETEFTHDVFMKENPGFLNLYEFVKDALMQKNGIFKITYDETPEVSTEIYTGLTANEIQMLTQDPRVEIVQQEQYPDEMAMAQREQQMQQAMQQNPQAAQQMQMQQPIMLTDVEVTITEVHGAVKVTCVAPEEFRVNQYHTSLDLSAARFAAHVTYKTRSELIEEGYDPEIINNAEDNSSDIEQGDYRWAEQNESVFSDRTSSEDPSQVMLEVSECYLQIDIEGTGVSKLHKVITLGSSTPTDILDIEPITEIPFVSSSTIIMSHKFFGLSIYDRLKQLQDQKTSLWRNIMDNLYLQNNREKEVVEGQVNLDDLLTSRPGGIKRVKSPGMIRELAVQPIGQEGYQMLDYLDQVRTGRVGVSPDTMGQSMPVGGETAHGVERMMTAKEELTGLMVRAIAETGLSAAYKMIRDLMVRHHDSVTQFKFKGQWAEFNPTTWGKRSRTTVQVGTGTGDEMRKQAAITQVLAYQEKLSLVPGQTLVDMPQVFDALDEFCMTTGLTGADKFFLDPDTPQGQAKKQEVDQREQEQKQKQDELEAKMVQAQQQLGQAEMMKGQAALDSQRAKLDVERANFQGDMIQSQAENQMTLYKQQSENKKAEDAIKVKGLEMQIKALQDTSALEFQYEKLDRETALKMTDMEVQHDEELSRQNAANQQAQQDNPGA